MIIGLEVELHSRGPGVHDIASSEGLNFDNFVTKGGLKVKLSVEYYSSTIEYNFEPHKLTKAYLDKVNSFILGQINKYNLRQDNCSPSYVGTHVHLFDLKFRKLKGTEILETTMDYINKEFHKLSTNDRDRLATSHQLWGNYVLNHCPDYNSICSDWGLEMIYQGLCTNRPKYRPYIISGRSNKGKPRSAEIRIIPNEFLLNGKLYDLLKDIQDGRYRRLSINDTIYDWVEKIGRGDRDAV